MFLRQAMRSVFNQTYPRIEFIVVEDGGATQKELVESLSKLAPPGVQVRFLAQEKVDRPLVTPLWLRPRGVCDVPR